MSDGGAEAEARRAVNRLRRAVEKTLREIDALEGAVRNAEGEDFPAGEYGEARAQLKAVSDFLDEEMLRLRAKILESGGLESGRVRRSSS